MIKAIFIISAILIVAQLAFQLLGEIPNFIGEFFGVVTTDIINGTFR